MKRGRGRGGWERGLNDGLFITVMVVVAGEVVATSVVVVVVLVEVDVEAGKSFKSWRIRSLSSDADTAAVAVAAVAVVVVEVGMGVTGLAATHGLCWLAATHAGARARATTAAVGQIKAGCVAAEAGLGVGVVATTTIGSGLCVGPVDAGSCGTTGIMSSFFLRGAVGRGIRMKTKKKRV